MKEIQLSQGKVALIDEEDFTKVSEHKWCAWWSGKNWYARSGHLYLHRFITEGKEIDHKNGNGLDCRRENLRSATHSQNMANRGKNKNNTAGFKGVNWCAYTNKWRAKIQVLGEYIHIGRYDTPSEAGAAYDRAAIKYFGEFAKAA